MAAEDILGISGQMDISDIQQSFDKLINDLNSLGVKTDEVSSKMSKALNDIANSSASDSEKTKQSVQTLKQGIEEINKSLSDTPEALKKLASEAQTAEATVDKLKKRLSETTEGSQKWNEINEQLKSQQSLVEKLNGEYSSMLGTFGNTQQYVGTLNAAIETLNAGRSISTAATGASAAAHVGAAAAVGTEAVAHGENSTKITEETEKTQENTQAKLHLIESAKDYVYTTQMEAEAIDAVAKRLIEGRSDEEEYINSKKSGLAVRESLVQKIEEEKQKIKELSDAYANSQDANNGIATPEAQQAYNEGVKAATDNIKEYRSELSTLNQSLDNLESSHFKAQQAINGQTDATQNLKQATEEAKEASDIYFNGEKATIEGVTEALKLDYQELKQLKAEYVTYKGAGDTENAKKNLEEQKELNKHIAEGRDVLKQLGTSYEDAAKGAKKTKEETKEVAKSAEDTAKQVSGIFSKFKGALSGAMKGDFSGIFSLFGKIGIWGAAITTVGKSVQWLSQQAESLHEALVPLKAYVDGGTLEELRQQFVDMEYSSTHSAEEMASAATRWVKYFEGLRGNSSAIADVTKSSNDLATVLGKTSEEAANYQLKIAGAFHQTATEAKENSTIIINASKNSTAKYEEMAQAISASANRAQNAGISLKELAAATAYGASTFGSASEAANAYVMMMTRLSSQSKNQYNPAVVGATKALENLSKSSKMNDTLTTLLGKRQASLAKVFVENASAIEKMKDGLDNQTSAEKTLNAVQNKVENQEKRLANAKRALAHEINVNLTPAYANFLENCVLLIKGIGNISSSIKKSISPVITAIGNAIDWLSKKIGNSLVGKLMNVGKFTISPTLGFASSIIKGQGQKDSHRANLNKAYNDNLKKYGIQSPGKAFLATLKQYTSSNGSYSKEDKQYLQLLMARTRAENRATVTGKGFDIGKQNAITGKNKKNTDKTPQQQRNYRELQAEQQAKQLADDKKIEWELYVAEQEEGIAKEHDASEKELKQRKLDFEKKKHQIEEEAETLRQKNVQLAKAAYDKNPANKKKEGFYASGLDKGVKLTSEQQELIDAKMSTLNAQQEEDAKQRLAAQLQSLYDYLKEYGTVQEQRYAIAKEYDDKILKATDENQKKILQKQKEAALAQTDAKKMAMGIDWGASFSGIGNVLKDLAKDTLSKVEEYMKTDSFKALPANDKKSYIDLRNNLREETNNGGSFAFGKWDDVANDVRAYQANVKWLRDISKEHDKAIAERDKAEEQLKYAIGDKAKEIARIKLDKANKRVEETGQAQKDAENDTQEAQQNLTDSTTEATKGLQNFQSMLSNITSGSLSGFAKGVGQLINSLSGGSSKVGDALQGLGSKVGGLVGAILSLIDAIGDDPTAFIDNLFNKIASVIENVLSQLPQIVWSALKGVGNVVGGIVKGFGNLFTGGAFDKWFGGNGKKVQEAINTLTESNNRLQKSIDKLKDTMSNSYGKESTNAYKEAMNQQKTYNNNVMEMAKQQMSYWGSHKSWNHYWNGFSDEQMSRIRQNVKSDFNGDITSLTPEEMKKLLSDQDLVDTIRKTGKIYKGRSSYGESVLSKLEDYADLAGNLDEITEKWEESITQISFDSMKDNFISNLMDMDKAASDFADDFKEYMQKALLSYSMEDLVNKDLKNLYEEWAKKIDEKEGNFTTDDVEEFQKQYQDIVDEGLKRRDEIAQITGYTGNSSSEQTATGKAIEAITADQASTLIGIGYAMQTAVEQGNETRQAISVDISSLRVFAEQTANNVSEMRDIQYQGLEQLEAINKNTAPIILIREDISGMYKLMKERY